MMAGLFCYGREPSESRTACSGSESERGTGSDSDGDEVPESGADSDTDSDADTDPHSDTAQSEIATHLRDAESLINPLNP